MPTQQTDISPDLKGQVIVLWALVYHQDADCVYPCFSWDQVLRGIEGSLRTYIDDDDPKTDVFIKFLMENLKGASMRALVPICLNMSSGKEFMITVYRWEIDSSTPLFRVLSKCYEQVDATTKVDIMALLSNPR